MAPVSPPNSTSIDTQIPNLSVGDNSNYPNRLTPLTSELPLEASDSWKIPLSPPPVFWDHRFGRDWETLLTGDNFDLDAVNMSLLYATSEYAPAAETIPSIDIVRSTSQASASIDEYAKGRAIKIQKKWHTFSEISSSGDMTPDLPHEGSFIDESYRKRLAERLQQRVQHGILPSTPFLVSPFPCVCAFIGVNELPGPLHPSIFF